MMKDLVSDIRKNAISYGSIPFWSWNDKLEEKELRRQIRRMHELHMKGFFMHARGGLETEYLSEEWYALTRACVDEAKKLGMEAWAYDENGWPSGFAGGKLLEDPANHATYLAYEVTDEYPSGDDVLGVYTLCCGKLQRIMEPCAGEYHVIRQKYDSSYVDTLDADITRKFIKATHEVYKEKVGFSDCMPGFFTDEPQYYRYATPFSNKLPEEFEKAYGYSVFSALPALFIDFEGAKEFRYDYYLLCHKLFIQNFIKVIYDWCEENGCMLTGHAVEEPTLRGQMWCCGGVMPFYEYEHIPGIDYLSRNLDTDIASKQLGSVCAQLGKKKALSEMFGCCGWDVAPRELKRIAELQYAGGINVMCQHLYSYSERGQRKADYPAHYSEHLPWQESLKDFNRFFNHLGYTLSRGEEYVNTLVIHPIRSAYLLYQRKKDGESIETLEREFRSLSNLLSENQIPYHWGDETLMAKYASVEGDAIRVGLCRYDYVMIPHSYTMDSTTAQLLKTYIQNGGKVWLYGEKPSRIDGWPANLSWLVSNCEFSDIQNAAPVKIRLQGENVPKLRLQIRRTEEGRIFYIPNLCEEDQKYFTDVSVRIESCKGVYELDMDSLEKKPVRGRKDGDALEILLDFAPAKSYVLVESDEISMEDYVPSAPLDTVMWFDFDEQWRLVKRPENAMTLDTVCVSYDGANYEDEKPLVAIKNRLYEERYDGDLWLKFVFDVKEIPESLSVAVEPLKYTSFKVNGEDVSLTDTPWYDPLFQTAFILPYIRLGKNEITMSFHYFQRAYVYDVLYGDVSESLRNCLNFDVELENIYLFGDFALETDTERFVYGKRNSVCYDGAFSVKRAPEAIHPYDIVTEGYPFFAGKISLETDYIYRKGDASVLFLHGRYATAEISVNGKDAGTLLFTDRIDLAPWLCEGKNSITVTLCNSNRNLLGPHHQPNPEPFGVGPKTFSYEKQWKNGECADYLARYAFVRFGFDL